ncbi:hypothetical protein SNE40_017877 [Patella caerulea]|uniref:Uncharacterized protein n=1 Tax=Patella caerulea TaxID=87958 RepID=A0AAN8JD44_PATCE
MVSYNRHTHTEIPKSNCNVKIKDKYVRTSSDIELEKESISRMIDELEDALERREEPVLAEMGSCNSEVFKGDCGVEMKADSVKTSSSVKIETEKDQTISKMIDELEAELERRQELKLDRNAKTFTTEG